MFWRFTLILTCAFLFFACSEDKSTNPTENSVATPTFNPAGGTYTTAQTVTILCATDGAVIRYTLDGTAPTDSSLTYSAPLSINQTATLKARSFKDGWSDSEIATAEYVINLLAVATPTFNPQDGTYTSAQSVTISCATSEATIRYTTNGDEPVATSTLYTSPVPVNVTTTLKARAFREGMVDSEVGTGVYTIQINPSDEFILVPGGTFQMGVVDVAEPVHSVILNSFSMCKHEVTQMEWTAVMGSNPSSFSGYPNRPVEQVSWYDIIKYCNLRSMEEELTPVYTISGSTDPANWGDVPTSDNTTWNDAICNWTANGYRLPTEAEWEFAARGGNSSQGYTYSGSNDLSTVAWYGDNSNSETRDVMTKTENELGLFDMSGNVWEWCWDWHDTYPSTTQSNPTGPTTGSGRVFRGGCWYFFPEFCQNANRALGPLETRDFGIGFRLCRMVQ
jgi:formylglycine-generating enzyme